MLWESQRGNLLIDIEVERACLALCDLKPCASLSVVLLIQRQVGALLPDPPSGLARIELGYLRERQSLEMLVRVLAEALVNCVLKLSQLAYIAAKL